MTALEKQYPDIIRVFDYVGTKQEAGVRFRFLDSGVVVWDVFVGSLSGADRPVVEIMTKKGLSLRFAGSRTQIQPLLEYLDKNSIEIFSRPQNPFSLRWRIRSQEERIQALLDLTETA